MSDPLERDQRIIDGIIDDIQESAPAELAWNRWVALSSVLLTIFAALSGSGASLSQHEAAMLRSEQTQSIAMMAGKRSVLHEVETQALLLSAMDKPSSPELSDIRAQLERDSAELSSEIEASRAKAADYQHAHERYEYAAMLLSLAIALCGMAIILRRKWVWGLGLALGTGGFSIFLTAVRLSWLAM